MWSRRDPISIDIGSEDIKNIHDVLGKADVLWNMEFICMAYFKFYIIVKW